jgi:hypothetical protein
MPQAVREHTKAAAAATALQNVAVFESRLEIFCLLKRRRAYRKIVSSRRGPVEMIVACVSVSSSMNLT